MSDKKKNEERKAPEIDMSAIERVLMTGDLTRLNSDQRLAYYKAVCESVGLNPLTQPFEYVQLPGRHDEPGKTILYCRRSGAEQLRQLKGVRLEILSQKIEAGMIVVHVRATDREGRVDEDYGLVPTSFYHFKRKEQITLKGEELANAVMKCVSKAKRRATLSLCGLGFLADEDEVASLQQIAAEDAAAPKIAQGGSRADAIAAALDLPNPEPAEIEHHPEPAEAEVSQEREPTLFERIDAAATPLELSCLLPDLKAAADRYDESMARELRIAYKQRMDALQAEGDDGEAVVA